MKPGNEKAHRNLPARAALDPIWEFIYIAEALIGLLGSAQGLFVSFIEAIRNLFV